MDSLVVTPLLLVMGVLFVGIAFTLGCLLVQFFLKRKMIKKIKLLSSEQLKKQEPS